MDPTIIKKYGAKRDKMLNTEDKTETDFLYGPDEVTEEDVEDLMDEFNHLNIEEDSISPLDRTKPIGDEIDFGDETDSDDEPQFLRATEDDDATDIAENAYDNM